MVAAFRAIRPHIAASDSSRCLAALPDGDPCVASSRAGDQTTATAAAAGIAIAPAHGVPRSVGDAAICPGPATRARLRAPKPPSEEQARAINRAREKIRSGG